MCRIVAPISGRTVAAVAVAVSQAHAEGAHVAELRLDLCQAEGADCEALVNAISDYELPILATNRRQEEGGQWQGGDAERLGLLLAADRHGAGWIDVEQASLDLLPERPQRARLIVSFHDFDGMGGELGDRVARMFAAGADIAKVAVTPQDAADLCVLADLAIAWGAHADTPRQLIAIGMGAVGLPSRLLAGAWGCAMTFGRIATDDAGSAPGQPTVQELRHRYRVDEQGADTAIYGVLGDPVAHSLSPVIHNAAFQHHGIDAVYVPFLAHDAVAFWHACQDWIDGLSITIPHKTALLHEMDELEELAMKIGAINTIYRDFDDRSRTIGANTDAPAAVECVEDCIGTVANRQVLLLGAGGVSRAIAFAMQLAGAEVIIANRTQSRAEALAEVVGCRALDMERSLNLSFDVLVNGTSVGMQDDSTSPWPANLHRPDTVVFDTVYTPLETRLLVDAQAAGAHAICGLSMLLRQAVGQFVRWTDREPPAPLMRRLALEQLGVDWQACDKNSL